MSVFLQDLNVRCETWVSFLLCSAATVLAYREADRQVLAYTTYRMQLVIGWM